MPIIPRQIRRSRRSGLRWCRIVIPIAMVLIFCTIIIYYLTAKSDSYQNFNLFQDVLPWLATTRHECQWPPADVSKLTNLKLPVCISNNSQAEKSSLYYYVQVLKALSRGQDGPEWRDDEAGLKQVVDADERWRFKGDERADYRLYPQLVDVQKLIEQVKAGEFVDVTPINNPDLPIIRLPSTCCPQNLTSEQIDLVVIVKSCAPCIERRSRVRQTFLRRSLWPNFNLHYAFVVARPVIKPQTVFDFYGYKINHVQSIKTNLTERELLANLEAESDQFGDLLIGDFNDHYFNLTRKMMFKFRFVSAFCSTRSDLVLFIDDDYRVIPQHMIQFVRNFPHELKSRLAGGTNGPLITILRLNSQNNTHRYSISPFELPWKEYAAYSSGAAYMIGSRVVRDASIAMSFTREFRIDDAYFGLVLAKMGQNFVKIDGMTHGFKTCADITSTTLTGPMEAVDKCIDWSSGRISNSTTPLS